MLVKLFAGIGSPAAQHKGIEVVTLLGSLAASVADV